MVKSGVMPQITEVLLRRDVPAPVPLATGHDTLQLTLRAQQTRPLDLDAPTAKPR